MIDFNFTKRHLGKPFEPYRIEIDIKTEEQHSILRDILWCAKQGLSTSSHNDAE